jgi:uncharacterized membrane protein SirB2
MAKRNTTPGLLERNTAKGLSPFIYIVIGTAVIDNSRRKREARRSKSLFCRAILTIILTFQRAERGIYLIHARASV